MASGQIANRERGHHYPSADNQNEVLLSTALLTRARFRFTHSQSLPSGSLHKSLILIHQRRGRRSKKNHNPTAARTKTTLQKANQDEKAESYVPDEGTR